MDKKEILTWLNDLLLELDNDKKKAPFLRHKHTTAVETAIGVLKTPVTIGLWPGGETSIRKHPLITVRARNMELDMEPSGLYK